MTQWLNGLMASISRASSLRGFWKNRTTFYRDIATSIQERELPNDFIAGELGIAMAPATQDKNRAKGLSFMRDVLHASDISLHEALLATMPKGDSLALGTLKFAKNVPIALRDLAKNIDSQQEMTKMVRAALLSPLILLPATYAFAYILSSVSIPEFVKSAPEEVWQSTFNVMVRDSAALLNGYGHWFALAVVLSSLWVFIWALPNLTQSWRFSMERSRGYNRALWIMIFPFQPVFALYRDISGTKMLGNLANLMQSGMLLKDALMTLAESAQPWMRRHLVMVHEHLDLYSGDYVGAFAHGVLPTFLLSRMNSMVRRDAGGQFDKVLIELGTTGMIEARESVKRSAVVINAVLLAVTLSVITFFYIGQGAIVLSIQDANSATAVMRRQVAKRQVNIVKPVPSTTSATAAKPSE